MLMVGGSFNRARNWFENSWDVPFGENSTEKSCHLGRDLGDFVWRAAPCESVLAADVLAGERSCRQARARECVGASVVLRTTRVRAYVLDRAFVQGLLDTGPSHRSTELLGA